MFFISVHFKEAYSLKVRAKWEFLVSVDFKDLSIGGGKGVEPREENYNIEVNIFK